MDAIRIERLRCLSDTGYVQIKPLTVFLGQNSSGKSTFLRFFPLLKQSIESRTTGPILWYGRLVDFGNFHDAHQTGAENTIAFSFKFTLEADNSRVFPIPIYNSFFTREIRILNSLDIYLTLEVSADNKKENTRASKLILQFKDSNVELEFNEDESVSNFKVNSLNILDYSNKYITKNFNNRSFLPIITEFKKKESNLELFSPSERPVISRLRPFTGLFEVLIKNIQDTAHHYTSSETILKIALSLGLSDSETMLKDIQENKFAGNGWKRKTKKWTTQTKDFKNLRDLIIANIVPSLIEKCDDMLTNFSRQVNYMGPVRATAERYYRTQDLAVDEVDYQGRNLTMFLHNLKDSEMQNFSDWTLSYFGFQPSIESSLGHISLKIRSKDSDKELNIADTGFGFSQILPIITQLWFLSSSTKHKSDLGFYQRNKGTVTYAIEQPELHLHPRLQGSLTDALVAAIKAAKDNNIDLRLIIETHSEVLINRLGHLIDDKKISPDDINIVLFEPSYQSGEITIRNSHFDSEGYLMNWPLGFFNMESV
ncbi:AAA family ATPase [Anabaena sphaerica FACHB-251]|uniref:AAA family ATPase n=1 Tax=Anabaena sphaerica FACHB-251 TaxID=2692883 RepID=A0A927A007_9NOST|nr:AAA family ATPase [Anabaena sphaerica]MBD2293003.1 AAA family ATPase [Anabaena sphaerica FACHB-251]